MKRIILLVLVVAFSLVVAASAQAGGGGVESPIVIDNVPQIVGIAAGMAPDYQGSKDYKFVGAPFFKYTFWNERYVSLIGTELNVNMVDHPWLRAGLSVNYVPGRGSSVENVVIKDMKKIDDTVEVGGFVGAEWIDPVNSRHRLSASLDYLHDVANVSNGYTITLAGRWWYPVATPVDITIGASTTWADDNYMQTYFGVTPENVGTSGLPFFDAHKGIRDVSLIPGVVVHLSREWHVAAGFRYQYLCNDAKESPVVKEEGNANQWIAGLGVAYVW